MDYSNPYELRNILTVLGFILTIVIYLLERRYKYKVDKKKSKKDWFLNIVLSPQLENLNNFYDEVVEILKSSVDDLASKQKGGESNLSMLLDRRLKIESFKNYRKSYFNNFSATIRSFNGDLANKFDEVINELDDIFSKIIEKDDFNLVRPHHFIPRIYENKTKAYKILFSMIDEKSYKTIVEDKK